MKQIKKLSIPLCLALILSVLASCNISPQTQSDPPEAETQSVEQTNGETATESGESAVESEDGEEANPSDDESVTVSDEQTETYEESTEARVESTETHEESTETHEESTETREESTETREESTERREESTERREESTERREESTERHEESTKKREESTETREESTEVRTESTEIREESTEARTESTETREEVTEPEIECEHTDENDDGRCDDCKISVIVIFDLYAINDLHGKIFDNNSQPGVDELTTYLKNAKKDNPNTVVFSSGDMWQGTAESGLTYGKMMTDWMNELDFAFMTLGNHEFDWGESYVAQNSKLAEFPFLGINVYDDGTRKREDYCDASIIIDLGEIQIGFIGAIGNCYSSIAGDMNDGFYFLTGSSLTNLVKSEAQKLRAAGADFIVYSVHEGIDDFDPSITSAGYVDIVFEGHTHQAYTKTDTNGVYHVQGGGENQGISRASVSFNIANLNRSIDVGVITSSIYSNCQPDDIVDELKQKYSEEMLLIDTILGYNDIYRNSDYLTNLVAELYADLGEKHWSGYNIVLGGGKLSCRSPYNLGVGQVKYGDLYSLLPFNNKLALCSIKGSDLLSRYINNTSYNVAYTAYGESVKGNINRNATYYIITDSYNYSYSWNNLTVVDVYDEITFARDLVAAYVQDGGMGNDPTQGTATLTSIPKLLEIARSLDENEESGDKYYVKGTITEIKSTTYGSVYIKDESGNTLYIYGIWQSGTRYDGISDKPQVGDTVILYGKMKNYVNGTNTSLYEMVSAELISKE